MAHITIFSVSTFTLISCKFTTEALQYPSSSISSTDIYLPSAVTFINAIGVDVIGVNCSHNPFVIAPIVDIFAKYSKFPILVMPNAGLPTSTGEYSVAPKEFANALLGYYKKGASLFGGCCGTAPAYIGSVTKILKNKAPKARKILTMSSITSGNKMVELDNRITIIGERINPTGKPKLKQAIKDNDLGFIVNEAIVQENAGATVLDVNCGLPDIDESKVLATIVQELQSVINLPLQIDSVNSMAIENAVRIYNGKPLINSVSGEVSSMAKIFPIAKKYGAAVIGLTLDENGIPAKAKDRFLIAKKIVDTAKSYGIEKHDVIIDCLVLTASAQQPQVLETIRAIRLVKEKLKVKTVLGVSNVSYGLPNRPHLNSIFLIAALAAGLDSAIVNPMDNEIVNAIRAFRVINNNDIGAADYIANSTLLQENAIQNSNPQIIPNNLKSLIIAGLKEQSTLTTKELLLEKEPFDIINNYLIPALDFGGREYESGKIFLPQLIKIAETAKKCFDEIKDSIKTRASISKGKIILATVKGDVHDIGKNIVKVLLQSYGYEVIDLGKDVEPQLIVDAAIKHNIKLVGLSALMTTTIPAMAETIKLLSASGINCKTMVGGAVLTPEYTKLVGADFYAKDAMVGVKIADRVFG